MRSSSDEEESGSGSDSIDHKKNRELVDKIKDSKENRELVDKIRDFNKASQLLKEKSNGGSAPETVKQGGVEKGKVTHKQQF